MFEFTSTIPAVIDYNDIVKVQSTIRNLQDLTPTLNMLCGAAPVAETGDDIMVSRSYENRNGIPLVVRGSKALKIGGKKEDFTTYDVDPFIMLDSYTETQLNQYKARFKNNPEAESLGAIRNKFIELAMKKGYVSLNGLAIKATVGGNVSFPRIDGNGQVSNKTINFGKVHGTSATDYTLNSFAVSNISTSSKLVDFIKNDQAMTMALIKNGVNTANATRLLGETLYYTVLALIEAASSGNVMTRGISIGEMGDGYFILNGRKYILGWDSFTDPLTAAVTKVVENKEMKIIAAPSYHLWAYLKPDEIGANGPVLYYAKDWYENNPSARTMLFNMRHFIVPDTNAIAKAVMMA